MSVQDVTLQPDELLHVVSGFCYNIQRNCDSVLDSQYRTYDGSCNNLEPGQENFGSIDRAMKRRLPTAYKDGAWEFWNENIVGATLFTRRVSWPFINIIAIDYRSVC